MFQILANFFGLAATWGIWLWLITTQPPVLVNALLALLGALAFIPIVFAGRWLLDRQPSTARAVQVTTIVHYVLAALLGSAIISAIRVAEEWTILTVPIPPWLGLVVMILGGLTVLTVAFNLIVKGLGLPFALSLTRVVVTDWMYAWTRNPMALSALAFLVGLGLWLRSGLFLVWLLAVASPAILVFLKVYEERELEVRFGEEYLKYRTKTPMLLPRRPR